MSNNLTLSQLATNQASPETPVNDANGQLDAALTEILSVDLSGADAILTDLQLKRNIMFKAINATVARNIIVPAIKRGVLVFESDVANTADITLTTGTSVVTMHPGRIYIVTTDGTTNGMWGRDVGGYNEPNDVHVYIPSTMSSAAILYRMKVTRAFTLKATLPGSYVSASVAATGSTTLTFKKNGTSIGTAVFAATATTATFTFAADVTFAAGDIFTIEGPATADATLANTSLDLKGQRS